MTGPMSNFLAGKPAHSAWFSRTVIKMDITPPISPSRFAIIPRPFSTYEKLNAEDKALVPSTSYEQAQRLVKAGKESKVTAEVKKAASKKYVGVFLGTPLSDIPYKSVRILSRPAAHLSANPQSSLPITLQKIPETNSTPQ